MTEDQKKARKASAESGHIKWIKDHCLRTMNDGEDYVFISYKSDDYERALDDILYRTCRKYGLRVYFDVAFDDGADSWINQFYDNMCSKHCRAMIAFLSNKYYSSYATLMEMMARKTRKAGGDSHFDTLFFLPINLEDIVERTSDDNTGLGTARFSDGRENDLALKELEQFNKLFKQLAKKDDELDDFYDRAYERTDDSTLYREGTQDLPEVGKLYLKVTDCRALMGRICPKSNANDGGNKDFEEVIHDKLLAAKRGSVFIPDWKDISEQPEPPAPPVPPVPPEPSVEKCISLPDFLKKYNNKTFKLDTFQQIRLVGRGECAKYSSEFYQSTYPLVWSFVEGLLKERGEEYIRFVNKRNAGLENPPFIPLEEIELHKVSYALLEVPGLEGWAMNKNYSQYDWVSNVLRRRMKELGLPLEAFSFEYVEPGQVPAAPTEGAQDYIADVKKKDGQPLKAMDSSDCSAETVAEIKQCPPPQIVTGPARQETKITGPVPLGGYVSPGGGKKTGQMKFPEMVAEGKVCAGDGVYVKGMPDQRGIITADGKIAYGGQDLSLNQYVKAVLGDGSYNAYIYVYHENTRKLLNDLR